MAGNAMFSWEGVLARPHTNVAASTPIRTGVNLYEGLSKVYKLIIVTYSSDENRLYHWLNAYGLRKHVMVLFNDKVDDEWSEPQVRIRQLKQLQGSSFDIDVAVEPNPEVSAAILAQGVQTLTFSSPRYSNPSFRPDARKGHKRSWDSIAAEMDKQEAMAASDKRIRLVNHGADTPEE